MENLNAHNIIQASEDSRVNMSAYLQLEAIKNSMEREGKTFDPNKSFYLERATGGSVANAEGEIRNSLELHNIKDGNQEKMVSLIGRDIMRFKAMPSDENKLGGFTYNNSKAFFDKAMSNPQEFQNSMLTGVPFTFGINMGNIGMPMPEISSYDFLSSLELGMPTGNTLFGASEVLTLLDTAGEPTNITNGSTTLGQASFSGSQKVMNYKVVGFGLSQLDTMISGTAGGYAGDNLIQQSFGRYLEIAKAKVKTHLMRDFYNSLATAKDGNKFLVPSYTMNDIDNSFANKSLTEVFSSTAGVGEFITKIIPAVLAPSNKFLDTNQAQLSRMVMHTSFKAVWENSLATYALTGQTQGQTFAGGLNLQEALKNVNVTFGGDISPVTQPEPLDLRILLVADPSFDGYKVFDYGFCAVVIALAPTIMATYGGAGFTNQMLVTKYSTPEVKVANRAMFLLGQN